MNEAELLFTGILKCSRQELYLNNNRSLDIQQRRFISEALKRRISAEPIQYILGRCEFMDFEFKVNPAVLIPRPETEILVETVVRFSCQLSVVSCQLKILDIGTGSGNIAVSLAKFLPDARITAVDICEEALGVAKENALLNNVANKIDFVCSDLFTQYAIRNTQYDIIVSNPPYIPTYEIVDLQPEVQYEPKIALDGGIDGLNFYRRIISESPDYLKKGGLLFMEMGFGQHRNIKDMLEVSGIFEVIDVVKDYGRIKRVIVARKRV